MKAHTLFRRCAAEGISIAAIQKAIPAASEKLKTGGIVRGDRELDMPMSEAIERCCNTTKYTGGFMYPGTSVYLDDEEIGSGAYVTVRGGNQPSPMYKERIGALLLKGSVLRIEYYFGPENNGYATYLREGDVWQHVESFDSQAKSWEQNPFWLPEGIRKVVAERLGYDVTATFHAAFDAAVALNA